MRRFEKKSNPALLFFLIGLLTGSIVIFFAKNYYDNSQPSASKKSIDRLTKQADNLLTGFITLQQLNEKYALLLADKSLDTNGLKSLDSVNVLIEEKQVAFQRTLDSLQTKKNGYDEDSYILLIKITDAYIAALKQSGSINTTRNSVNIGNTNYNFDQSMVDAMQRELREKQLQLINLANNGAVKNSIALNDYSVMMKQQDSVVTKVLQAQKKRNQNLSDYNTKLKRDNDQLIYQLQALRDANANNQVNIATTVTKGQLSEQLDLAKADCYLTRADVRHIISNSKQRRELLQQALQILNALARSTNTSVKQQAEAKLDELKSIAANNHD